MSSKPDLPLFVERGEISLKVAKMFAGRGQKKGCPNVGTGSSDHRKPEYYRAFFIFITFVSRSSE
ncbi:MAG: hypothetical protein H6Q19_949 [Bacteroidetes bacterium]|nr:hypothetical protein [Bacteroidota bacterium]